MYIERSMGGGNISVAWCQPVRLLQVVGLRAVWWSILSFLPPTLLTWVFSCLAVTPVRIRSITERLCSAALTATLPSIQPLATTLLADTTLLTHFHCPHSSLYILLIGATGFLLNSWTLRMGPIGCPEMSARNYHYLLFNNPEEHSSQLLRDRSLKSSNNFNAHDFNNYPFLAYIIYLI